MRVLRQNKKWLLIISIALLAILAMKTILFLTAKPKITVDYVAEYNRTAHPQDYDPNDNAAPYYQKAFDAFVDMPEELQKPYIKWPADFNDIEQALLEKWLISNTPAFEYFRESLNKPYYWIKRTAETDNYLTNNYVLLKSLRGTPLGIENNTKEGKRQREERMLPLRLRPFRSLRLCSG